VAFGWFRLFDSFKPWPAGWADREVEGGFGVVLDDLFAAVYAAAATAALVYTGAVGSATAWLTDL
jgi:phosphatidylglycerophosphatase A